MVTVKVKKLHQDAKLPTKGTKESACWDVYSVGNVVVQHGGCTRIGLGLAFEIPSGWFLEVRPRSGYAASGLLLLNSPAVIDSDFRGEVCLLFTSLVADFVINKGSKVAQIRLVEEQSVSWEEVSGLSTTERGSGGFGSTGR